MAVEFTVWVDCAREGVREPVQRHGVEDRVDGRVDVGPLEELVGDPKKMCGLVGLSHVMCSSRSYKVTLERRDCSILRASTMKEEQRG